MLKLKFILMGIIFFIFIYAGYFFFGKVSIQVSEPTLYEISKFTDLSFPESSRLKSFVRVTNEPESDVMYEITLSHNRGKSFCTANHIILSNPEKINMLAQGQVMPDLINKKLGNDYRGIICYETTNKHSSMLYVVSTIDTVLIYAH